MKKPANKSAAVRQQRAAKDQEEDTPEQRLHRALNYFPTPPWGARAGAEILLDIDPAARTLWEPACGEGHMAEPLKEYFPSVRASDIHAHGYGEVEDFLLTDTAPPVDWVVSNPPFDHAGAFIRQGLRFATRGVAMLLRIAFLEGRDRYPLLYLGEHPMTLTAVFCERLPMVLGAFDPEASSAVCMAWFFFQKGAARMPVRPIPPGTKDRLHRREDVRRFAKLASAPLFDRLDALPDPEPVTGLIAGNPSRGRLP